MKMPDKIGSQMFAPCGIDCMVCYVHLREKKPCNGCLGSDENKTERCRRCAIKECAKEKGITYCMKCGEFPCRQIKNLEKSYVKRYKTSIVENSIMVRENGFDAFFSRERLIWTCKECGGVLSLHDAECSECHDMIRR
ncbi:MAG: DUF3795 domain-containing protein [Clostridia bacterium]|nr:DUF3795 domain-containing protein [Clostridia bacterium]